MDATENVVVALGELHEDRTKKKKSKKRKMKGAEENLKTDGEKLGGETKDSGMAEATGTEIGDPVQEGELVLKGFPVGIDDNIASDDKGVELETYGDVASGNVHEEKKGKKRKKKSKKDNAVSIAAISEKGGNMGSQTQNNGIEQTTENKAIEGTEIHDQNGTQEGALLRISPLRGDGNIIDNDTTLGKLQEEKKDNKKPKKRKKKLSVAVNTEQNLETEGDKLASQTHINGLAQVTGNQTLEGTEIRDGAQEGCLLPTSSSVGADDAIISKDKTIDKDLTENVVTVGNLHEEKRDKKMPETLEMKKALSIAVDPEQILQTEGEKVASQTQNNVLEQATVNQAAEGTEIHEEKREKKMPETLEMKKALSISVDPEQILQTEGEKVACQTQNNVLEQATVNQAAEGTEIHDSPQGACADHCVTASEVDVLDVENPAACKKKWAKRKDKLFNVPQSDLIDENEEKDGNMESSNVNDEDSKHSREGNNVTPGECIPLTDSISEVAVLDAENTNTCKKKLAKRKRKSSGVSQSGLNDKDGGKDRNMESSSVNDEESKNSREENNVVPEEGIPLTDSISEVAVLDAENPDTCKKKWTKRKRKSSSVSQSDLNDTDGEKDRNMESSFVNDGKPKNSSEGNDVAPGEGIPLTASISVSDSIKDVCRPVSSGEAIHEKILLPSLKSQCDRPPNRKLLILDINGLLADILAPVPSGYNPDLMLSRKAVFKRPFCESFLKFCFEKFDVGVWSSRVKINVDKALDFLMGEMKNKLVFYWDRSHCTITGFPTIENRDKPLVLKELRKLWDDHQFHLGKYDQTNTLLLDDSPYKALCNPADTAIFPVSYQYKDVNDCSLGPGGDLRVYLEKLAMADNIPEFVRNNPFGQRPIRNTNLSWNYYKKVIDSHNSRGNR